jgi:hypothetical protein
MAETPVPILSFKGGCPDCGQRRTDVPGPLPAPGDDFDWRARDFDGFRRFMLEELAARFPDRRRWTPADVEVVLVEALAAVLDELSDMTDRVFAEAFLETARRPESVRRLLSMIGYDAVAAANALRQIDAPPGTPEAEANAALEAYWRGAPAAMDRARRAGPDAVFTQRRMVTVADHGDRLEDHPMVLRAMAYSRWTGSWITISVAVIPWDDALTLDSPSPAPEDAATLTEARRIETLRARVEAFHRARRLPVPDWAAEPTVRSVLTPYLEAYRMAGREVELADVEPVGVVVIASLVVRGDYFRSEIETAARQTLGRGAGGFFEPGRLRFGEDLFASDVIAALMALDGVETVCLIRFKRAGAQHPDRADDGSIPLSGLELAVCDSDPARPERGYVSITLHGGRGA